MRTSRQHRRGFSLVEIITALTILAVIGGALTRMVVSQTRSFQFDNAGRRARTASRSAMNILITDLRMTQDTLGVDSVDAVNNRWVDVKVPIAFGIVCAVTPAYTTIALVAVDSFQMASSKYAGYAVRQATGNYTYLHASASDTITSVAQLNCSAPGVYADTVKVAGRDGDVVNVSPSAPAGTQVGDPAFIWQHVRYEFAQSGIYSSSPTVTRMGLWRRIRGRGNTDVVLEELIAPFNASARFSYFVRPGNFNDTASRVAPDVRTIRGFQIYLPAESSDTVAGHTGPQRANTTTAVFFKNTRVQ